MFTNLRRSTRCGSTIIKRNYKKDVSKEDSGIEYCANLVKQHDYENFLSTLLMTKSLRTPAFVVRAFNVEVARIQDQTSDSQTAAIRLQFWHDALSTIFKKDQVLENIPANPVAKELYKCFCSYGLQRRYLEKLISSRSSILKSKYFRTIDEIEHYAEDAVCPVYYLILKSAGVANVNADHVASHLGRAQGIVNVLRSVHVANRHKMISIPMEVLMKHNVSQESVLRCEDSENMRNVTFEIATRAFHHLEKARSIQVPKITHQIFLPAISLDNYLTKLEKYNFDLYHKTFRRSSATLPLHLYFHRVINKF